MKPFRVHLDKALLGPPFASHTPTSFCDYVESLREQKAIDKPPSVPRTRVQWQLHVPTAESCLTDAKLHTCEKCGRRYRPTTKLACRGTPTTKKVKKPVDTSDAVGLTSVSA